MKLFTALTTFRTFRTFCTFCTFALCSGLSTLSALPEGIEHVQTLDGIQEYKLSENGLRVLLMPNEGLPVATVMVTYEVGARNEVAGTTGATHILEHMMFKGTDRFNSENSSDYSSVMERIGARSNATTYFDRTNYYATLPREYVSHTIELEADRMRNLRIREEDLASEMTVVRNEYERGENNPVRTLIKEIYASAFIAHPYSHPTIGWRSDIENTSTEKLRAFYNDFYWPENAVLTVIGGFDIEATLESVKHYYGVIPNAPKPIPTVETTEPKQLGPRRLIIERTGQVGVVMTGFKAPEGAHEDWAALTLIEQILGADKTGRLYRALEDQGKASATFTFAPQLRDPSLFILAAYLTPDATHEATEAIILDEIKKLISGGVSEAELARAKAVIQANTVYGRDGPFAIASQINEAIAMGDWTTYVNQPKAIQTVTTADIQRVAAKYFVRNNSTTGWFVPQKSSSIAQFTHTPTYGPNYFRDPAIFGPEYYSTEPQAATPATTTEPLVDFSSQMQHATVGGIQLVAIDMPIDEVVSFVGSFAAGETLSPPDSPTLAGLTASMLDQGTKHNDRFVIAERLDTLGADIRFNANAHSLQFSGKFLREDAGAIMRLLAEQLREPAFDAEVLENLKSRQRARLLQAIDNPDYRADAQLARLLYPPNHPNYIEPIDALLEDLERTTVEDIAQFHADHYGPQSMRLVFAGDIDFEQLTASVEYAFDAWTGGVDYPNQSPAQYDNSQQDQRIYIKDKTSVAVRYGQNTGLRRTDEDYLPFMLGNYILGGSFNSRLMQAVRKQQGLTYSIRSSHSGDILTQGNWNLSASFSPAMLDQGLEATDTVFTDWYTHGVSEDEARKAIETLSGSYLVGLSTTGSVAGQVHSFMQRGLPAEYIDEYPKRLQAVTAEQVNRTVRKYLNPELNTLVIAGSLDEPQTGEPVTTQEQQSLSIRLDTPDAGWSIDIEQIYRTSESLIVIAQLQHSGDIAASVISTVSDSVSIPKTDDTLTTRHYILGKTWDWGATPNYTFIESMDDFGNALDNAELIYEK
jgi:zinc protease